MKRFFRQLLGLTPPEDDQQSLFITFWRSTLGVFLALRLADVVNAVTGLWAIPSLLPSQHLGAVLPLLQVGAVLTVPITIFTMVFTRHLCAYAVNGDSVRTRGLLRDALVGMGLVFIVALAITTALLPWLCAHLHIEQTSAGYWAIVNGLLAAFTPLLWSALQALRKFGAISAGALLAAPIRLLAMLTLIPCLGLSGYLIGQSVPLVIMLCVALIALYPLLHQRGTAPLFAWWRERHAMLSYAGYIAVGVVGAAIQGAVVTFAIRHKLPLDASATYYLISRFAEIATYCGTTLATVLFPFALEARLKGWASNRFRSGVMGFILLLGGVIAAAIYWGFPLIATWTSLTPLRHLVEAAPQAAYLTIITTLNAASTLHFTHAAAEDRFTYLRFYVPCTALLILGLLLTPAHTLNTILHLMAGVALLQFVGCLWDGRRRKTPTHGVNESLRERKEEH